MAQQRKLTTNERWRELWQGSEDPEWHKDRVHPFLLKYAEDIFRGRKNVKCFLPLCGKVKDIKWLAEQGTEVVGVELSSSAIEQFFSEQNIAHTIEKVKTGNTEILVYKNLQGNIRIFCVDIFTYLSTNNIREKFDLIWDAQSLVSFSTPEARSRYVEAILGSKILKDDGVYLLEAYEYDPILYSYGPNLVPEEEIFKLFQKDKLLEISKLEEQEDYNLKPFYGGGVTLRLYKLALIL